MKKFTIEVSHASPGQLQTIAAELKIMSNGWTRFGPRIRINSQKLQAPSLYEPRHKRQATSLPSAKHQDKLGDMKEKTKTVDNPGFGDKQMNKEKFVKRWTTWAKDFLMLADIHEYTKFQERVKELAEKEFDAS